jgi:DNA-binding NtrC family response regulator
MPLELQPKVLRALQEQEFERLGSAQTVRVNVRVVTFSAEVRRGSSAGRETSSVVLSAHRPR